MPLVTAKVFLCGVPIEALSSVQSAMLAAGYKEMQRVFNGDSICKMPLLCNMCANRGESFSKYCEACKHANVQSEADYYVKKGGKDADVHPEKKC